MKSLTVYHCVRSLLISVLAFTDTQVAAQEGPGIVIAHPGQDVKLLCTVTVTSTNEIVEWLVNNMGPYGRNALRNGIAPGYNTTLGSNNLIVGNIMMSDVRNDTEHQCVIVLQGNSTIQRESDPIFLLVAGVPAMVPDVTVHVDMKGNNVTVTMSWGEPFNNLDPIVNYTVSCSGDVTCPQNFITTDNTTRSYTITNLTPMTNYIFSVVATNSIGSGTPLVRVINVGRDGSTRSKSMTITTTTTTTISVTIGSISPSIVVPTTAPTGSTSSVETTTSPCPTNTVCPPMMSIVDDDDTDSNGAVIAIVVVIIVLILCACIIMDILFCYCCKRKGRHNQDNEKDKTAHYSIIVLGILTCGTSVLLWWLYKELAKWFSGKDKYDVEGHSAVPLSSKRNGHEDKKDPREYDGVKGEDISIQGSPTAVTYAATAKAPGADTHTGPALQYDYARTGAITIVGMSDVNNTQQPEPSEPALEGYAVTDIIPAKDIKKDKKGKVDTKNQQPMQYAVVDKSKKTKKKDVKQQKNELNYMDPGNLEFKEEPRKHSREPEETVQYGNVAEAPKYTNIM